MVLLIETFAKASAYVFGILVFYDDAVAVLPDAAVVVVAIVADLVDNVEREC